MSRSISSVPNLDGVWLRAQRDKVYLGSSTAQDMLLAMIPGAMFQVVEIRDFRDPIHSATRYIVVSEVYEYTHHKTVGCSVDLIRKNQIHREIREVIVHDDIGASSNE